MITLAFTMSKGGVCKTTSTLNVSAALARMGKRVLMVDMDGQGNLSSVYKLKDSLKDNKPDNIYSFLVNGGEFPIHKVADNLYLVPGADLMHIFDSKVKEVLAEAPSMLLKERLEEFTLEEGYDVIIFDCPPKLDYNTMNVLSYVQYVFLPVSADQFSIEGVVKTLEVIEKVKKRTNKDLQVGGLFLTRYDDRAKLNKAIRDALVNRYNSLMLEYYTRNNVAINEAIHMNMDIFSYDDMMQRKSNGATDYEGIAREILFITTKENKVEVFKSK
jgi:chromosome partitioning protein